jgi:ATP-dependent 26S proteasome regulatory subunit
VAGNDLLRLFRAHRAGDELAYLAAAERVIVGEEAKRHTALAADLRRALGTVAGAPLPEVPVDRDSGLPLSRFVHPDRGFDRMVLNRDATAVIYRIVTDVRAQDALDAAGLPRRNRVLLSGPPGCGKTTAAAALAADLGRPLLIVSMEAVMTSYLGQTAQNISRIFDFANDGSYVMLLDEFDSLGQSRDTDGDHGEIRRVTNTVLQLIERMTGDTIVVAATNHPGALDAALWRRFDHVAELPLPTIEVIRRMLAMLLPGVDISEGVDTSLVGLPHAAIEYMARAAIRGQVIDGRTEVVAVDIALALSETLARRWV